jgi:hypothetical protein
VIDQDKLQIVIDALNKLPEADQKKAGAALNSILSDLDFKEFVPLSREPADIGRELQRLFGYTEIDSAELLIFSDWYKQQPASQTLEMFARWWYWSEPAMTKPPSLSGIRRRWRDAFRGVDGAASPKRQRPFSALNKLFRGVDWGAGPDHTVAQSQLVAKSQPNQFNRVACNISGPELASIFIHVNCKIDPRWKEARPVTICILRPIDDEPYRNYIGLAVKSPYDPENPSTAEQLALNRAAHEYHRDWVNQDFVEGVDTAPKWSDFWKALRRSFRITR